jgi:hypothetical protein
MARRPAPKNDARTTNARAREPAHEPKRLARICERIRGGLSVDASCWAEGIDPDAVRSAGRQGHDEVRLALEQARADAEAARVRRLDELIEAGKPTGGATWMLERLHRKSYHIPQKVALGGDPEAPPMRTEGSEPVTEAQLLERLEVLRSKLGGSR